GEQSMQAWRQREAFIGETDRRLEEPCPGQLAMPAVRERKRARHSRRADATSADDRLVELHRLAVNHEQVLVGLAWRGLPAVVGLDDLAVPVQQEGATAQP